VQDALEAMEDVREYDVPFHMRWAIDTGVRCGWWYTVKATVGR
jgi:DNA polymerase epsilon subunit 1